MARGVDEVIVVSERRPLALHEQRNGIDGSGPRLMRQDSGGANPHQSLTASLLHEHLEIVASQTVRRELVRHHNWRHWMPSSCLTTSPVVASR